MWFSRYLQDRRGSVAPMFALAVIPVFGLVGAAVDYSRANSIKAGLSRRSTQPRSQWRSSRRH